MLRDAGLSQHLAYTLQLSLGGLFLTSFVLKLRRPGAFVRTVAGYRVLPRSPTLEVTAAVAILGTEAGLAVTLLTGMVLDIALAVAGVTVLAFAAGVMLNLRRGRTIACGCFGSDTELISGYTLLRLGTLLSAVIVLACLHGLTAAHEITAGDALDEPAYLVEVAGIAVVGGLLTLWALNAQSVSLMVRSFRTERHT